jgi:hypothetical protein
MRHQEQIVDDFVNQYLEVEEAQRYIIYRPKEDPEYVILLFRNVGEVHCYYRGYGLAAKTKSLYDFATPEEVLEWALSQRDTMELVQHEELSPIDKIFLGLDED